MANISTILAALLLATSATQPVAAVEKKIEITQSQFVLGKETVGALRAAYEKGEYNDFLRQMDAEYQQALSQNGLDGLIEMRQKEIPADFQAKWDQKFIDLQKQKNKDLLAAVSDKDQSVFAEKVRSVAGQVSTPEQEKAINRLHSLVQMAPQTGANDDENKLIAIDLEYEYKLLHATMPQSDISPQQRQDYQIVLRMEKMDKMMEASKTFQEHSLKQAVGLASANLDERLARNLDGADLNAFVKAKGKSSNETEKKVTEVLSSYQGQFSDLMKEIAQANS